MSFFWSPDSAPTKAAVPERAMVPRFSTSSSWPMPMPLSATVRRRWLGSGVSVTRSSGSPAMSSGRVSAR